MTISLASKNKGLGGRLFVGLLLAGMLIGCDENGAFNLPGATTSAPDVQTETGEDGEIVQFVEEEVEKPDVFYAKEAGLWDGRPTFGGVWVSHPDTQQPEKVIIRNQSNGRFVVGALFRIERDQPGPSLRLSSDAAEAIAAVAGSPVQLEVVALRTEKIPVEQPEIVAAPDAEAPVDAPAEIEEKPLDPIVAAGAAIEAAAPTAVEAAAAEPAQQASTITAAAVAAGAETEANEAPASKLANPFVQVATFSVEKNAEAVAEQMKTLGLTPLVRAEEADGKPVWRVVVGPISSRSERRTILRQIRDEGYADAYSVKQ